MVITMKIAIIGAGAMGMLFGAKLQLAGNDVTMVDVVPTVLDAISANGIIMREGDNVRNVPIKAGRAEDVEGWVDLAILFTKTLYSKSALTSAVNTFVGPDTYILTLQNGIGNVELIRSFVKLEKVLVGVTNYASDVEGPGKIAPTGDGYVKLMSANLEDSPMLHSVEQALSQAGLQTTVTPQVFEAIWEKVGFNAAVNSMTAICRIPVGGVGITEEGRKLAFHIADETAAVAQAHGVQILAENIHASLNNAFGAHKDHFTSMAQDVLKKRRTEVAYINGGIVRKAAEKGLQVPYTEAVYDLLRVIEETYALQP